jgi:hypothetical protein
MRWWRRRKPEQTAPPEPVFSLAPGESATISAVVPKELAEHGYIVARWTCGGCNRNLRKSYTMVEAQGYGMSISCPYCDPDNVYSRDVELDD